jgi:hypothetical protein
VLLLVDMPAIHARLREVFLRDWALGSRE